MKVNFKMWQFFAIVYTLLTVGNLAVGTPAPNGTSLPAAATTPIPWPRHSARGSGRKVMLPESQRSRLTGPVRRTLRGSLKRKTHMQPVKLSPERREKKCKTSSKIRWLSELDARMAICNRDICRGSNTKRTGHSHHEVRVYQCPDCQEWHTTHLKEYRK